MCPYFGINAGVAVLVAEGVTVLITAGISVFVVGGFMGATGAAVSAGNNDVGSDAPEEWLASAGLNGRSDGSRSEDLQLKLNTPTSTLTKPQ